MGRPKTFDRDETLQKAIGLFGAQGYAATSPDQLMNALCIGRQSMYDTFGNKRTLFLTALDTYVAQSAALLEHELRAEPRGLGAIRRALVAFAGRDDAVTHGGCMAMNAVSELGTRDADVLEIFARHGVPHRALLLRVFRDARRAGELGAKISLGDAADYFDAGLLAIRAAAKMGATRTKLETLAELTARALAARELD